MSEKLRLRRDTPSISRGFIHGLAQMGSVGRAHTIMSPIRIKTSAESLRGDWVRLGHDMALAMERVRERGTKEQKSK